MITPLTGQDQDALYQEFLEKVATGEEVFFISGFRVGLAYADNCSPDNDDLTFADDSITDYHRQKSLEIYMDKIAD